MDSDSRMCIGIIIIVVFIFIKGFITACETAVIEVNDAKVKKLAETEKKAKRLAELLSSPNKLLTSLAVLKAVATIIVTLLVTVMFYGKLKALFTGMSHSVSVILSVLILVVATTLLLSAFGDNIPKAVAKSHIEKFPFNISGFLKAMVVFITPFEIVISGLTYVFSKIFGLKSKSSKGAVTEEEILLMVDAVNETGGIETSQKEMINNIFEFSDLDVSEVMTHRTEIVAVDKKTSVKELAHIAINEGFSRIPVYENNVDNIIGAVYVKDLLHLIGQKNPDEYDVCHYLRDILYVPQTNQCKELFKLFTQKKAQIAVVVDEYGGTAGLITMEDLLESIVGNIQDEYDNETEDIVKVNDNVYEISGTADATQVMEKLKLEMPDEHDYDTIGGLVIDLLGYIPDKNQFPVVDYKNVTFKVVQTEENRIEKLRVKINYNVEEIM